MMQTQPLTWSVNLNPNRLCPDLSVAGLEAASGAAFRTLEDLGAGGIRVDLFWRALEPAPGQFNEELFAWYKDFFIQARDRDIKVFTLLYHPPEWAMTELEASHATFLASWRRFCHAVGARLGGLMDLMQIWNEPNNFLAAFKHDPVLFHTRKLGPLTVPVGVPWETLAGMFAIARDEMPTGTPLVYNVIANLCPFLPMSCGWLDWETFTERFMALAKDHVDVIAVDHYPDTWAPGTGPLEWECLDVAARHVNDPQSSWYGKSVILGEVGYSSTPNFHLLDTLKVGRFFPEAERDEASMARWYAIALSHLASKLTPETFPHNRHHWVNVYELFDPPRPLGGHPLLAIEDHFGLVRRDGVPKAAFLIMRDVIAGARLLEPVASDAKAPLYWRLARFGRSLQARLVPTPARVGSLSRVVPQAPVPAEVEPASRA